MTRAFSDPGSMGVAPGFPTDGLPVSGAWGADGAREDARARARSVASRVSVIIPTRDRRDQVVTAIDSVLAQSVPPGEIVLVDDQSRDGTVALLAQRYPDEISAGMLRIVTADGEGQGAARNRGLIESNGEWVAYLDSDNTWCTDHLLWTLGAGVAAGFDVVYSAVRVQYRLEGREQILCTPFDRAELLRANYIDTSSLVHSRALVDRWGGWDRRMSRLIDWEFVLRLTNEVEAALVPVVTVHMIIGDDSATTLDPLKPDLDIIDGEFPLERCLVGALDFPWSSLGMLSREPSEVPVGDLADLDVDPDFGLIRQIPDWDDHLGLPPAETDPGSRSILVVAGSVSSPVISTDLEAAVETLRQVGDVIVLVTERVGPDTAEPTGLREPTVGFDGTVQVVDVTDLSDSERLARTRTLARQTRLAYFVGRSDWAVARGAELRAIMSGVPVVYEVRDCAESWLPDMAGNGATLADLLVVFDETDQHATSVLHNVGEDRVIVLGRDGVASREGLPRALRERGWCQSAADSASHQDRGVDL